MSSFTNFNINFVAFLPQTIISANGYVMQNAILHNKRQDKYDSILREKVEVNCIIEYGLFKVKYPLFFRFHSFFRDFLIDFLHIFLQIFLQIFFVDFFMDFLSILRFLSRSSQLALVVIYHFLIITTIN